MSLNGNRGFILLALASASMLLASCGTHRARPVGGAPAARYAAPARYAATARYAPPARYAPARRYAHTARPSMPAYPARRVAPLAFAGSNEAVLRLRAGLNVAALSCRGQGRTAVTPAYSRILTRHRALLATAYRTETQRLGQAGLDRQQTRVYNRFANQRSPAEFCRGAVNLANQAGSMASPRLAAASPQMVAQLESQLR